MMALETRFPNAIDGFELRGYSGIGRTIHFPSAMREGIRHIEFWVSDLKKSLEFYSRLFAIIKWRQKGEHVFVSEDTKIYFSEREGKLIDSLGPRHICFYASSRKMVDEVGTFLLVHGCRIIRGPTEMPGDPYPAGYYTVDFRDPDGYILEVAYTPDETIPLAFTG